MKKKIGLIIIATNKYITFLNNLLKSANIYFLPEEDVTYFIFTNKKIEILDSKRNIVLTNISHKEWPWMTLGRYEIFSKNRDIFSGIDYLYYCDVDMRFVDTVGSEILEDRVVTQHPFLCNTRGTPETNPLSLACVKPEERMQYFAGGFNGGSCKEFLKMSEILACNIEEDFKNNIISIWHDESHLNRYMIDNPPTKILDPGYCYAENLNIPYNKKLLALEKNHSEVRD